MLQKPLWSQIPCYIGPRAMKCDPNCFLYQHFSISYYFKRHYNAHSERQASRFWLCQNVRADRDNKKSNRPIRAFCQNTAISDLKRYGKEARKEIFGF